LELRKTILSMRDKLSAAEIKGLSSLIHQNLKGLHEYATARFPLFFASFRSEVETLSLIANRLSRNDVVLLPKTLVHEKRLLVFRVDSMNQLAPGAYGILEPIEALTEPIDPAEIDLVLVPGSVFDRKGGRYGYGGGFYDRFLQQEASGALRVALAFSFQVLDNIPLKSHDQLMDFIVTERRIIQCAGR